MDSAINLDMKRLKLISQMIKSINRNGDIEFSCEAFAEFANKDCAHYLKDMNTESVELGLQTVNPEALKNVSRFFHPEKFKQGCSNLREKKLKFHIGILNGLPGDNFEWVKKTFEFAKQCAPTSISSSIVSVDPATKLHREAAKFKLKFEKVPMYRALSSYSYSFFELCKMQQYLITEIEKYNQSQVKLNSLTS